MLKLISQILRYAFSERSVPLIIVKRSCLIEEIDYQRSKTIFVAFGINVEISVIMKQEESDLWCVIYISTSKKDITVQGLEEVLATARVKRKDKGITGLEICARSSTLSLVEGQKDKVISYCKYKVLHAIHLGSSIKVYEGDITGRFFANHYLAFKSLGFVQLRELDDFGVPDMRQAFKKFLQMEHPVPKIVGEFIKGRNRLH